MNTFKLSFAIVLLFLLAANSYAQRCGDGIQFSFTDESGNIISKTGLNITGYYYDSYYRNNDSEMKPGFKLKYPEFYQVKRDTIYVSKIAANLSWQDSVHLYIPTVCGMLLLRLNVEYMDKKMQLDIYNIHGDIPYKAAGLIIREGSYELNLNGYFDGNGILEKSGNDYLIKSENFKSY